MVDRRRALPAEGERATQLIPALRPMDELPGSDRDSMWEEKVLYIDSRLGDDFRSFLSTASGFGTVDLRQGRPFVEMKMGELDIERVVVSGREMSLQ